MNIYLAGFLLATLCISGCFGACPVGNPATYSIDGTNSCTCSADGRHACTRMMPMTWPDGSVRCRKDYYADPCNLCQCVNGRGVCTLMVCASKFWDQVEEEKGDEEETSLPEMCWDQRQPNHLYSLLLKSNAYGRDMSHNQSVSWRVCLSVRLSIRPFSSRLTLADMLAYMVLLLCKRRNLRFC